MKSFSDAADLALLGAPPAYAQPLHVGRPNIGDRDAFMRRMNDILDRRWLSNNGPMVQEFERSLAEYLGVKHVVAMCNGTVALEIAIRALDLTGEVIVPSYTFIATAHALHWQAITPVFADIRSDTHTLDPEAVRRMITPRTTGIIGVHLWGRACDVEGLQAVADEHGLQLMFDAAHAFACTHKGTRIGNFGRCEVFSFHATKFFNSFEGGAVATNDDELARQMRLMANFGFQGFDNAIYPGTNGKMTEVCAAMGLTGLESLDSFTATNRRNHGHYASRLNDVPGLSLLAYDEAEGNNFQYVVVEVGDTFPVSRNDIIRVFHAENILARKYFWPGCHAMLPYRSLFPHARLMLPETLKVADRVIVLPTGTAIEESDIECVTGILRLLAAPGTAAKLPPAA